MKVSYDKKNHKIITWWNEKTGSGSEDLIYSNEELFKNMEGEYKPDDTTAPVFFGDDIDKVIYDLPDIDHPDELPHNLLNYMFTDGGNLILNQDKIKNLEQVNHEDSKFLSKSGLRAIIDLKLRLIDVTADVVRAKFITITPGQMNIYNIKEQEAIEFKNRNYPIEDKDFIFLRTESEHSKISMQDLADNIIKKANDWKPIAANIEGVRVKYKKLLKTLDVNKIDVDDILIITEEAVRTLTEI